MKGDMKMTATELIKKYNITLHIEGQIRVSNAKKLSQKTRDMLVAAKPEIIAELQRREQEKAELKARELAEKEAEKQAILAGEKAIHLKYHDGEHLSGHFATGQAAEVLMGLGIANYVSGWGCHVDLKAVEALGEEFTYPQAALYASPMIEAKTEAIRKKYAERQEKFDQARETGKPVLLSSWSAPCCDPREECSWDNHYEHAMPDGRVKKSWNHTW